MMYLIVVIFCVPVKCSLKAYQKNSPWSSPWLWKRLLLETQYTSFRYQISRDIHRCSSLITPSSTALCIFSTVTTSLLSNAFHFNPTNLFIDFSTFNQSFFSILFFAQSVSCHFCTSTFPFNFFSCVTPFQLSPLFPSQSPFVFSLFFIGQPLSLCLSSLNHLLLSSFISLHYYSYVFHDEALEFLRVPIIASRLKPDLNT